VAAWLVPITGTMSVAWAEAAPSIIRDAEVESTIRSYANPLFRAAGLPLDAVTIRVLNSSVLNAFVTNGNRMFLHSGLILETKTPGELTGVIAHETGHIVGGHLVRLNKELENAALASMGSLALGILAGLASGRSDAGMAAMSLGQQVTQRNFFSYTRTQEASADQYALKVLDATHQSAQGMIDFFETLVDQELLTSANQDPYMRTHPVTTDRIAAIRAHVQAVGLPYGAPTDQQLRHDRMVAKLFAFLEPQGRTLQRYPESDHRLVARYARAIAYFRRGDLAQALPLIDGLIDGSPKDPYFWELKGQMLFENGRLPEAADAYRRAVSFAPDQPLIDLSLAHVLVESGGEENGREAETYLRKVITAEPRSGFAWRLLGSVYGQRGDETQASYAMAEYAMLTGDPAQALFHINKALNGLKQSDPLWLKLQDLKSTAERAAGKEDAPEK
jgi:predicted Zn-dependent protease